MRRPGDKKAPPPGGRAAARLRLYVEQREPVSSAPKKKTAKTRAPKKAKKR